MSLDTNRLENVHTSRGKTVAGCPACIEAGGDQGKNHLAIFEDGSFACVQNPGVGGAIHRKRISELAGDRTKPARASRGVSKFRAASPLPLSAKPVRTWPTAEEAARALSNPGSKFVCFWTYQGCDGGDVFAVARYELPHGKKKFLPMHKRADGWALGDPSGKLPLYRTRDLATNAAGAVLLPEGEKCADALAQLGFAVTTSSHGAKSAAKTDWTPLAGRSVYIFPDHDAAGQAYVEDVACILTGLTPPARVRIVALPGLSELGEGADIVDWLEHRDAADDETLRREIQAAMDVAQLEDPATTTAANAVPTETLPDDDDVTTLLVDAGTWITNEPPPVDAVLTDTFDMGDKIPIIGSSKSRKSFFALQLALSLASGLPKILNWNIPKHRRVLVVQMEVKPHHYWRRLRNMARKLGLSVADLGGRLSVASLRGREVDEALLTALAKRQKAEVIIVDPLYKLLDGDENLASDMKPTLALFDRLAEATGAAVLFVHHNSKGSAGDKATRDRGAGSGVLARDFDACLYLSEHRADDHFVVEVLLRNYAPQSKFTISWDKGCFEVISGLLPVLRTSANSRITGQAGSPLDDDLAMAAVEGRPRSGSDLEEKWRAMGCSRNAARVLRDRLLDSGRLQVYSPKAFPRRTFYGTPEGIAAMKTARENPFLEGINEAQS